MANNNQLFIPQKIKVGFQERNGTYTGKLAYVIYFDQQGVLRKEKSWTGWRNDKIPPVEYENKPTEGFVLNKNLGGGRGWDARNEWIRVYDPRDFEFEISIANLLFILKECDCSRGKGLEGKFVYSWSGDKLVLLPANSQEYKNSIQFTDLKQKNVKSKDLVPGLSYLTKKQESLVFIGRYDHYTIVQLDSGYAISEKKSKGVEKMFIFWNGEQFLYFNLSDIKKLAVQNSDVPIPNLAELIDKYYKSPYGSKPVGIEMRKKEQDDPDYIKYYRTSWFIEGKDGEYIEYQTSYPHNGWNQEKGCYNLVKDRIDSIEKLYRIILKDGIVFVSYNRKTINSKERVELENKRFEGQSYWYNRSREVFNEAEWIEPTENALWVKFESGSEYRINYGTYLTEKELKNG